jgi:hypothetical protein
MQVSALILNTSFQMLFDEAVYVHETQNNSTAEAGDFNFAPGDPTPERPL